MDGRTVFCWSTVLCVVLSSSAAFLPLRAADVVQPNRNVQEPAPLDAGPVRTSAQPGETTCPSESQLHEIAALVEAGEPDATLGLIHSLQEGAKQPRPGLDRALLAVSAAYLRLGKYAESEAVLQEVIRDYPKTSAASQAMLGLAEVAAATCDLEKEFQWLTKAARFPIHKPIEYGVLDTDHSGTIHRVALRLELQGRWAESLRWWETWQTPPWHGLYPDKTKQLKRYHICLCKLHTGQVSEAVKSCLDTVFRLDAEADELTAILLYRLYRDGGQQRVLARMLDRFELRESTEYDDNGGFTSESHSQLGRNPATWPIREALRIEKLADRGQAGALAKIATTTKLTSPNLGDDGRSSYDWQPRLAAEGLARCGDQGVQALRNYLRLGQRNSWLFYALGRSDSPEALVLLRSLATGKDTGDSANLAYAISMHGEAGVSLLNELAADNNTSMNAAAKQRLLLLQRRPAPVDPYAWPRPKPGALPLDW